MIGKLDQRIKLQSLTQVNNSGSLTETYTDVKTVWGHVISAKGTEAMQAARENARRTIRVKIRYRDDVDIKWRFVWKDEDYNIREVDRTERRNGWLWLTGEVVGAS